MVLVSCLGGSVPAVAGIPGDLDGIADPVASGIRIFDRRKARWDASAIFSRTFRIGSRIHLRSPTP